jgi:type I restriction enzyme R subunit
MTTQSEQTLENNLIAQLGDMKYERVTLLDEAALLTNLRQQLEKHNEITFSNSEFAKVLNHLGKGSIFERAQTLRDKFHLVRDDNSSAYIEFFNMKQWCQNQFQVTNQVTVEGSYKNRYDVTILINGLPLVQIELKRRGLELKEAFNQTNRYQRHSYGSSNGLFQFIQLFVISNGVNTKYYANTGGKGSFKFTSFWADKDNKKITDLHDFAQTFLERCHIAKMIAKYTVLAETKNLMVLRPYQFYAVERIVDRVKSETAGGYIWHTTGSGKTLTSFKASQILLDQPEIYKVVFVVDRNDLDTQTIREFNSFKAGSVDTTNNTDKLVKQFGDPETRLIVTTIQKLNNAVSSNRHLLKMDNHKDEKIVFIFDECHRSQFGDTHKRITEYFTNYQLFGFTGTPIFEDNASGSGINKRTTADLFGECLHKYVITDAINDANVLKFSVEYVGKYRYKNSSANEVDIDVEAIDTKELMESPQRLGKIVDYIIANHDRKTHSREFNSIFAISNVDTLTKYYDIFKTKQADSPRKLRVATIFSYTANEDDKDASGNLDIDVQLDAIGKVNQHTRDKLESYIGDYNKMFATNYTTKDSQSFYSYYRDIASRVKKREIDILLVVNMFLTGFDSKTLNTLYVDKNLRYHGLLQAYSRTNRILNDTKSQGNIVVFRNLKDATDKSLELFANKNAKETIFLQPYEDYLSVFNKALDHLHDMVATPQDVDNLVGETAELDFVTMFRELLRAKNVLESFADFKFSDTGISEQEFENYKSKYLDIYDKVRNQQEKEKVSILEDVDFELELVRRDSITVDYILRLLAQLVGASEEDKMKITQNITTTLAGDAELRSKRELIEKFISTTIPEITDGDDVEEAFDEFWSKERTEALARISQEEGVDSQRLEKLIEDYIFTNRKPRRAELAATLEKKPSILQLNNILKRISGKVTSFIETFVDGA